MKDRDQPKADPELTCERCGRFGAFELGNQRLCLECYECAGSCCPEFGADDLWKDEAPVEDSRAKRAPGKPGRE